MRKLHHAIVRLLVGKMPVAMNIASNGDIIVPAGIPPLIQNVEKGWEDARDGQSCNR